MKQLVLVLSLGMVWLFAGCTKSEPPPQKTESPAGASTGSKAAAPATHCQRKGSVCELTVSQIKEDYGKAGHTCGKFEPSTAIHVFLGGGKQASSNVPEAERYSSIVVTRDSLRTTA